MSPYLWKLTVMHRSVRKKASSTPSPWWMSMSMYTTREVLEQLQDRQHQVICVTEAARLRLLRVVQPARPVDRDVAQAVVEPHRAVDGRTAVQPAESAGGGSAASARPKQREDVPIRLCAHAHVLVDTRILRGHAGNARPQACGTPRRRQGVRNILAEFEQPIKDGAILAQVELLHLFEVLGLVVWCDAREEVHVVLRVKLRELNRVCLAWSVYLHLRGAREEGAAGVGERVGAR